MLICFLLVTLYSSITLVFISVYTLASGSNCGYCTVVMCLAFVSMCYVAVTEAACLMCIQIKGYIQSKLLQCKTP